MNAALARKHKLTWKTCYVRALELILHEASMSNEIKFLMYINVIQLLFIVTGRGEKYVRVFFHEN
jgi:hypothetical protein